MSAGIEQTWNLPQWERQAVLFIDGINRSVEIAPVIARNQLFFLDRLLDAHAGDSRSEKLLALLRALVPVRRRLAV